MSSNLRKSSEPEGTNESQVHSTFSSKYTNYYGTADNATLNYLNSYDPSLPYPINALHLQQFPYKRPAQKLHGYNLRDTSFKARVKSYKGTCRTRGVTTGLSYRETGIRSRYSKKQLTRREAFIVQHYENENVNGGEAGADINSDGDDPASERAKSGSASKKDLQECLKNSAIGTTVQQYCTNSSLHGLRYVGDSNLSLGERVFWMISFAAAVLTAVYYIWFLYRKWVSAPIIISLSPESVSLNEFPFPSVTICNMNNAKKTEAARINRGYLAVYHLFYRTYNTAILSFHGILRYDPLEKLFLEDICHSENNSVPIDLNDDSANWNSMLHFMINVSQPCTDMLYACQWYGNQTDCEKLFNPTITDEGICCNFNSVHRKHLFYNPRDWSDLNVTFPYASIDWNPEFGYEAAVPADAIPWRPYGAGQFYGLTLILDAEVHEYYCSSTASVGFKMLLHNPVETPKIADFAFAITPGQETRVVVTPRISTASRTILSIPRQKRKCFFTSERKLRYYRTYTQRNCVLECEANFTQKICQCVQHYMPKSSNTPICGKKDDQCATRARRAMEVKLYDDDSHISQLNVTETPSCNCWPACFETNYNVEISQSKLMSTFDIDDRYVKKNQKYFVENMAVVHLFFVDSQFTKYVKTELFGFTEFLSSTGGLLGLFMGFSFLSLMEILYFATLRFWCRLRDNGNISRPSVNRQNDRNENTVYPFAH